MIYFLNGVLFLWVRILLRMETTIVTNMEKLSGANFSLWKSQMEDILILKDQYLLIKGVENKSSSMRDEEWNKLDRKVISMCLEKI